MSQTLRVSFIALVLYAVYLPVALWLGAKYEKAVIPTGRIVVPVTGIRTGPGFSYVHQTVALAEFADAGEDNMRSPLMLYENLTPLGPARSYIRDVQQIGRGRFCFTAFETSPSSWKHVIFSTSDNSSPLTNGRKYWLVLP